MGAKRILITGSGSWIGMQLEQYLTRWADRYQVDRISVRGDDWKSLSFSGYDAIYHVAAIVHQEQTKTDPAYAQLYHAVNGVLPVELARKARQEGVKQFVFLSTFAVYGAPYAVGKTTIIDANTPLQPEDNYGISKLEAENGLRQLETETFRIAILRPPVVYGPGCKGNYTTLQKFARKLPVFPDVGNQRFMLYIDNLSELVRLIVERNWSGTICPQNREQANTCTMVQWIGQEHGKQIIRIPGMTWSLKLLGRLSSKAAKGFASIYFDESLSAFPEDYNVVGLRASVTESERMES